MSINSRRLSSDLLPLIQGVAFRDSDVDDIRRNLGFSDTLNFLTLSRGLLTSIIGFHADETDRDEITPAVTLEQRAPENRRLQLNAKGVGIILGNSPLSVSRPTEEGRERPLSLWRTPYLAEDEIKQLHHPDPRRPMLMAFGILRHMENIAIDRLRGTDAAVRHIEKRYKIRGKTARHANAVTIDPAPTWLYRQDPDQEVVNATWLVYRDQSRRPLRRIGIVQS